MSATIVIKESFDETPPMLLHFQSLKMSEDQFFDFCQLNRDLRIERSAKGEISIMSPLGVNSGGREAKLIIQLGIWAMQNGQGEVFGSSTGFTFSDGAVRSPDAAWVSHARLKKVTEKELDKFAPVCPEFVIELKSPSDRINDLKAKYIDMAAAVSSLQVVCAGEPLDVGSASGI